MDDSASDPALEKPATVIAAASESSNVDMEYVRSLERQFAAHAGTRK